MKKKTLFSGILSALLVLALAAPGLAAYTWTVNDGGKVYKSGELLDSSVFAGGNLNLAASLAPTTFTLNFYVSGTWDASWDPDTMPGTTDQFTFKVYRTNDLVGQINTKVSTLIGGLTTTDIDNKMLAHGGSLYLPVSVSVTAPRILEGVYSFKAFSEVTSQDASQWDKNETWRLTPVPVPGAVWLLGSGLLGLLGFKRSRDKNLQS